MLLPGMDSLSYGFIGQLFYIINVYINLAGVLSEIFVREFLPCIPGLCG